MKKKRIILIAGGIVLLAAIICAVLLFTNKQEAFRTIQIYKIEGSAIVDRDGVGSIEAYNGMMMQSGDTVYTNKESCLYFKMDEDKFALLEPESTVHMEASGTSSDSRTVFCLESGALVGRLDSKLSPNSVYEVNTPNSTMAVRGTIFRIEVTYDEKGVSYTNVYAFDGTVECQLVFKDGSVDEEVKQAQKGVMVRIRGDDTISEYILDNGTVDYGQLPVEVLRFLKVAIEEGIELPLSKEELEAALAELEKGAHVHSGGTATCISPAVCSYCGQAYGEKDAANHTGRTEIRNLKAATCAEPGYTGDTYCLDCGEMIEAGSVTEKDTSSHVGGTEIRDHLAATCKAEGYSGDTYCLGCGNVVSYGGKTAIDPTNHTGGEYLKEEAPESCCDPGYTGDKYCVGCDKLIEKGTLIAPTGNHPAAACGVSGHHLHDGKSHAVPSCGTTGHCISDGLNHDIASCQIISHHNCDGETHGKICYETDSAIFEIEVIVTDNGSEWSFTLNGTVYEKYQDPSDSNQYFYYFRGNAGDTIVITRTGMTGDFYAVSEITTRFAEDGVLTFTLNEDEEEYYISVFIS